MEPDECKPHLCFEFISQDILSILYPHSCKTHKISSKFGFVGFLMESKRFSKKKMQNVSKKGVNRMSHNASLRRSIFMYHLEHKMVQLYSWLHSIFKELSNDTSHTQAKIRVQTKRLCHQQVEEENKSLSRFCSDRASDKAFLQQNLDFVATELVTNSVATKPDFVVTEPVTRLSCEKTHILSQQS